jgi:hypothetical protein
MDGPDEKPDEKMEEFQKQKTIGETLGDVISDILKRYNATAYENDEILYMGIRDGEAYLLQKKVGDGYITISSVIPKPLLKKVANTIGRYIPIKGLDKAIEGVERAKAELTLQKGEYILKFDMRMKQENTQAKDTLEELFRKTMNYFLEQHGVKIDDIYGKENIKIENSNYQIIHSKNGDTIIYSTIPKPLLKEIASTVEKYLSLKSLDSAIEKVDEAGIAMIRSGKDYTIYFIIKTNR